MAAPTLWLPSTERGPTGGGRSRRRQSACARALRRRASNRSRQRCPIDGGLSSEWRVTLSNGEGATGAQGCGCRDPARRGGAGRGSGRGSAQGRGSLRGRGGGRGFEGGAALSPALRAAGAARAVRVRRLRGRTGMCSRSRSPTRRRAVLPPSAALQPQNDQGKDLHDHPGHPPPTVSHRTASLGTSARSLHASRDVTRPIPAPDHSQRTSILPQPPHALLRAALTAALPFARPSSPIPHSQRRAECPPALSPSCAKSKAPPATQRVLGKQFPFSLGSGPCPDASKQPQQKDVPLPGALQLCCSGLSQ